MNSKIPKEFLDFCRRYNIDIIDSNPYYESYPREIMDDIRYSSSNAVTPIQYYQYRSLIIRIPQTAFETLAKETEFYSKQLSKDALELLDELIKAKQFEKRMRQQHPTIQEAWERYIISLSLAADGPKTNVLEF